jgi:hypothetical protein
MRTLIVMLSLLVACDDSPTSAPADTGLDGLLDAAPLDAAPLDATPLDATPLDATPLDAAVPDAAPTASDYCEATADVFCPYYLRCGRMAVPDLDACRATFLSNCNGVYEPVYSALAEADLLRLSGEGIAACAAHLEDVACDQQIFDLDGPCGGMWIGQSPVGGSCAPGIESFVCAPGSTCVLGLDFCGTCAPVVPAGADCAEARCAATARCVDDRCVARALPGEPCEPAGCVAGARCVDDLCAPPARAAVGEACDRSRACPYRAACVDGACVVAALIGEPCGARPCAGGVCVDGQCAAPGGEGTPCDRGAACIGQLCVEGACSAIPGPCFTR